MKKLEMNKLPKKKLITKIIKLTPEENNFWDVKRIHTFLQQSGKYDLEILNDLTTEISELYKFIRAIGRCEFMRNQQYRRRWNGILDDYNKALICADNRILEFPLEEFKIRDEIKNDPAYANIPAAYTNRIEGTFYFKKIP